MCHPLDTALNSGYAAVTSAEARPYPARNQSSPLTGAFPFPPRGSMDRTAARTAYAKQKSSARSRGIEWEFNFESWLDWWGYDFDRRGTGPNDLQMQRFADSGPYASWNVKKGAPRDNAATRGHMTRKRNSEAAKAVIEAARDACTPMSKERPEMTDDELELQKMFAPRSSRAMFGRFTADE